MVARTAETAVARNPISFKGPFVVVILGLLSGCGESSPPSAKEAEEQPSVSAPPRLVADQEELDLGEVAVRSEPHVARFVLTNRGAERLTIHELSLSCSCLKADIDKNSLEPMESAELRVQVRSAQSEERQAGLSVLSDDPSRPKLRLTVKWRAVAFIEFDPLRVEFGTVRPGQVLERDVKIIDRRAGAGAGCRITELTSSQPEQLTVVGGAAVIEQTADRFVVRLQAGERKGDFNGIISGTVAGCDMDRLRLPVSWTVRDVVEASPAELFLGFVPPDTTVLRKIIVTCDAGQSLTVAEARFVGDSPLGRLSLEQLSPSIVVVKLAAQSPSQAGEHRETIQISCTQLEQRTLSVPVSFVVRGETKS